MDVDKIDSIKNILKKMNMSRFEILQVYDNKIKLTLENSKDYLQEKGIDIEKEKSLLKKLLNEFDINLENAISQLEKVIIPNYEEYVDDVNSLLNSKINEISDLLDSSNRE